MRVLTALSIAAIHATALLAGAQTLDPASLDEALRLARTRRPADLERFSGPYVVVSGGPGSPKLEVITEFRRAVILARQQVDAGNHTWSPTNLRRALEKYAGMTSVRADVWLSPVHMYVGTPAYRLDLYDAARRTVMPVEEKREPIYSGIGPGEASSMTGVTLESVYRDEALRARGCCLVIVVDPRGVPVVEREVDLASLR